MFRLIQLWSNIRTILHPTSNTDPKPNGQHGEAYRHRVRSRGATDILLFKSRSSTPRKIELLRLNIHLCPLNKVGKQGYLLDSSLLQPIEGKLCNRALALSFVSLEQLVSTGLWLPTDGGGISTYCRRKEMLETTGTRPDGRYNSPAGVIGLAGSEIERLIVP
jgi:hypothetical protein